MRAQEFIMESKKQGTYACAHFSQETKDAVDKYIKDNNIPNPTPTNEMHATILYSRKHCPEFKAQGKIDPPYIGEFDQYQVWDGQQQSDGKIPKCLVMEFKCQDLVDRHNELMDEHNATYDFPKYKTHITFSYDIGDMKINKLPAYTGPIEIVEEYGEDLDLDWAENNTKD